MRAYQELRRWHDLGRPRQATFVAVYVVELSTLVWAVWAWFHVDDPTYALPLPITTCVLVFLHTGLLQLARWESFWEARGVRSAVVDEHRPDGA